MNNTLQGEKLKYSWLLTY